MTHDHTLGPQTLSYEISRLTSSVEVEAFLVLLLLDGLVQEGHRLVEVALPAETILLE